MSEITIKVDGKILSSVYSGQSVVEVAQYLKPYRSVYMVYDLNVKGVADLIEPALKANGNYEGSLGIVATEENKVIDTVLSIDEWLLNLGANRDAMVLAVGGGITTDMVGFAASIYKRGVKFSFVPTTLLSQVDAAIGGKTGVNFSSLKNMLGVIRQPEFTYECPEVLQTLPYRDFVSGTAELVKTFIIENTSDDNYSKAVSVLSRIAASENKAEAIKANTAELLGLISAAAAVKAGVVSRDQFESGERKNLNLGHTFAHAIEWEARRTGTDIAHGEAVSIGMILAARLSENLSIAPAGFADKLLADFKQCGLPTELPFAMDSLPSAMEKDKKAEGGKVHFVLMGGVGDVRIQSMTVSEAMASLK
ncbi:MAG: 3-dehydroquinate synthase [Bacteroidales bacterium]|nr:3-dehydroquinate synthase [Bacteroidales bacterium]